MVQLQHDHSKERSGKFQINSSSTGDTKKLQNCVRTSVCLAQWALFPFNGYFLLYTVYSR